MEYLSRVPRPPLGGLIDDLYYLEGARFLREHPGNTLDGWPLPAD